MTEQQPPTDPELDAGARAVFLAYHQFARAVAHNQPSPVLQALSRNLARAARGFWQSCEARSGQMLYARMDTSVPAHLQDDLEDDNDRS